VQQNFPIQQMQQQHVPHHCYLHQWKQKKEKRKQVENGELGVCVYGNSGSGILFLPISILCFSLLFLVKIQSSKRFNNAMTVGNFWLQA